MIQRVFLGYVFNQFNRNTMLNCCTTCISWEIGSYNTQQSRHTEHTHFCRNFVAKSATWISENEGGGVKGRLELFQKFITFGDAALPLSRIAFCCEYVLFGFLLSRLLLPLEVWLRFCADYLDKKLAAETPLPAVRSTCGTLWSKNGSQPRISPRLRCFNWKITQKLCATCITRHLVRHFFPSYCSRQGPPMKSTTFHSHIQEQ